MEGGSRESPRRARYFSLLRQRKVPKKKGDPQSATPALCSGANLRRGGCGVRRGTRFALRAPLGQPRRVSSRGMGASTPMPTPQPPRRRRSQQGVGQPKSQHPSGPLLRSAQLSQRMALAPARRGRAQRSEAMVRVDVRFGFPSARAEKRRAGGACVCRRTHALRVLTCRSCLNGARSAQ